MWLLDTFSRDRLLGHKKNFENNIKYECDKYIQDYDATKWWNDNLFCKFVTSKYPKIGNELKMAVKVISKRALPEFKFDPKFANIICDSLNSFAKYTSASYYLANQLVRMMKEGEQFSPIQLDFWVCSFCLFLSDFMFFE